MKVLIADDSSIVRGRLVDLLSDIEGMEVVAQAEDGVHALEMMNSLKPDVAIVDIRMPRRSGIDLLDEVRKNYPAPWIIVLTNYPTPENRDKCFDLGADYFFDKSSEIEKVVNILKILQKSFPDRQH